MTENGALKKILEHKEHEEKEHASMLLEGIRQNDEVFAKELKANLFQSKEEIYYVFLFKDSGGCSISSRTSQKPPNLSIVSPNPNHISLQHPSKFRKEPYNRCRHQPVRHIF